MSKWIKVEDKIPEYNTPVLVVTENGTFLLLMVEKVKYNRNIDTWKWVFNNGKNIYHTIKITHWMELPETPNGDNK